MKYKCSKCGEEHEGWPAIAFGKPHQYYCLSKEDRDKIATISDDFCTIKYEDQTDRFIRVVLSQTVIGSCLDLEYGLWVSVSEKTFNAYFENFDAGTLEGTYFGYLCSMIPGYENTLQIRTNVNIAKGKNRPEIIPHNDQMDIPFVKDYYNGITLEEAERRIAEVLGAISD